MLLSYEEELLFVFSSSLVKCVIIHNAKHVEP